MDRGRGLRGRVCGGEEVGTEGCSREKSEAEAGVYVGR